MMYYVSPMMTGHSMDIAGMLGSKMGNNWDLGMMVHFVNGTIIFPLIFVFFLYRVLPGSPWLKGTLLGIGLWLIAQVVVMPMMGGGLFSANMGGMKAVIGSLLGHIVYGATLGAITGASVNAVRAGHTQKGVVGV